MGQNCVNDQYKRTISATFHFVGNSPVTLVSYLLVFLPFRSFSSLKMIATFFVAALLVAICSEYAASGTLFVQEAYGFNGRCLQLVRGPTKNGISEITVLWKTKKGQTITYNLYLKIDDNGKFADVNRDGEPTGNTGTFEHINSVTKLHIMNSDKTTAHTLCAMNTRKRTEKGKEDLKKCKDSNMIPVVNKNCKFASTIFCISVHTLAP